MIGLAAEVLTYGSFTCCGWNPVCGALWEVVQEVPRRPTEPGTNRRSEATLGAGEDGLRELGGHGLTEYALAGSASNVVTRTHVCCQLNDAVIEKR